MLVWVNLVLLCGILVSIIVLLGRKSAVEVHQVHEAVGDAENAPILSRDCPSSALVRKGPEQRYGTFEDSQNGQWWSWWLWVLLSSRVHDCFLWLLRNCLVRNIMIHRSFALKQYNWKRFIIYVQPVCGNLCYGMYLYSSLVPNSAARPFFLAE